MRQDEDRNGSVEEPEGPHEAGRGDAVPVVDDHGGGGKGQGDETHRGLPQQDRDVERIILGIKKYGKVEK